MAITEKIVNVAINSLVVNRAENVREMTDDAYELENLMTDIALRGQTDPITVEKTADGYHPLKGFRRSEALKRLAEAKTIDPITGKPFETARAIVYEKLTPQDRVKLLIDHGQRKGLNKLELFNAEVKTFEAGYNERDTVVILRSLLEQHYPPSRTIKETLADKGKDLLDYYRGTIQTAKRAWLSPDVLQEAWRKKLREGLATPRNNEMSEMYDVFIEECEDPANLNKYNRKNPGPKFLARWESYLKKQEEAAANGEKKAKADSMKNRSQVEDIKKQSKSRLNKTMIDFILNKVDVSKFPAYDAFVAKLEESLTPEGIAELDKILA